MPLDADVIIIGAGLAGLVAAAELADAGRHVLIVDQEPEQSLGGQAFWSLGGLFLVDSPEQRRLGIRDSRELALRDWMGTAGFDRAEDAWPRKWAEAYVDFAAGEKRDWVRAQGIRFFPVVGWAERGGVAASPVGNSVPRFHLTWGTGPGVLAPFVRRVRMAESRGLVTFRFRHRVNDLVVTNGAVTGVSGDVLEASAVARGAKSSRLVAGAFAFSAPIVIVASGGIGANLELVRKNWPSRLGAAPRTIVSGVPDHVDGRMLAISARAGARVVNADRMWHYTEGLHNWSPLWSDHGIRVIPGPSSLWLDATGRRLPSPIFPGFDTLGTLERITRTGYDYTWFVLTRRIIEKEFALSGSEQNPDITNKSVLSLIRTRLLGGAPPPVQAFVDRGTDFVVRHTLPELVAGMNALAGSTLLDVAQVEREIRARDEPADFQAAEILRARAYIGDRLIRVAKPHRLLDPAAGPLIAVRLNILTRKSLGGLETDLSARVLGAGGQPVPGLYAAGEATGFGGGGMHGYRALEGTFLGGCLFSGRVAGRAAAEVGR